MTLLPVQPRLDQTINSDAPRGKETERIPLPLSKGRVSRGEHIVNHELSLLAAHPSRTKIYCPACTTHAAISYFIRDSANESYKLVSIGSGDDDDAGSKPTRDPCVAIRPAGFQR